MEDLLSFFYYISIAFSVWMGIDCIRRKDHIFFWLFAIFMFHPVGSLIYFYKVKPFQIKLPGILDNSAAQRKERGTTPVRSVGALSDEEERLKEEAEIIGGAYQYEQLGEFYLKDKQTGLAIKHLATALEKNPESLSTKYAYGKALFQDNKFKEAAEMIAAVIEEEPKFDYGYALFGLAEIYRMGGEDEKALEIFERVYQTHSFFKANVRYAELLEKNKRTEDGLKVMRSVVKNSKSLPVYKFEQESSWIQVAERFIAKNSPKTA